MSKVIPITTVQAAKKLLKPVFAKNRCPSPHFPGYHITFVKGDLKYKYNDNIVPDRFNDTDDGYFIKSDWVDDYDRKKCMVYFGSQLLEYPSGRRRLFRQPVVFIKDGMWYNCYTEAGGTRRPAFIAADFLDGGQKWEQFK